MLLLQLVGVVVRLVLLLVVLPLLLLLLLLLGCKLHRGHVAISHIHHAHGI